MKKLGILVAALTALAAAGAAQAQSSGGGSPEMQAAREAVHKACAGDATSLCADKQGRDLMMCLRSNTDKVSADCKDALSKLPAKRPAPSE